MKKKVTHEAERRGSLNPTSVLHALDALHAAERAAEEAMDHFAADESEASRVAFCRLAVELLGLPLRRFGGRVISSVVDTKGGAR